MAAFRDSSPARLRPSRFGFCLGSLALVALVGVSAPALARPPFPGIVQDTLDLTCAPPCQLCHTSPSPNGSNADQPFVNNLILLGQAQAPQVAVSESTLPALLKQLETAPCQNPRDPACAGMMPCTAVCNADGSGDPDITELRAGDNPNNTDILHCPRYGCGAHVAPTSRKRPIDGSSLLVAFGAVAVLVRRWRR